MAQQIRPFEHDTPRYSTRIAAEAANLGLPLLRKWEAAGLRFLVPRLGDVAGGRGEKNLYTFRGVVRLALVAELHGWGMPVETAIETARAFTDIGETGFAWGVETPEPVREPGAFFAEGRTVLLVKSRKETGKIINVLAGKEAELFRHSLTTRSALVIDLEKFCEAVAFSLPAREGD